MAISRAVFSVLLLCVVCNATNVPVILWGDLAAPNVKASPLQTTSSDEFASIITKELVEQPLTVVFVEESLSNEDFSRRNAEGETSFAYIHANIRKASYLPSVEDALPTLEMLADPKTVRHIELTEDGLPKIEPNTAKFIFISLKDAKEGESRFDMLRRHNDVMRDTMAELRSQYKSVVAVYTARNPSWVIAHRVRRQATTNNTGDYLLDGLRLYAKSINVIDGTTITPLHGFSSATSAFSNDSLTMSTTLNFQDNVLLLNFRQDGGYWFFDSVALNSEEMYPTMEVYSLIDFSYRCGQNVTFQHGNSTEYKSLFFEDLKVQPVFQSTNESSPVVFGDSFNCVGFFSAPIWSGLFVVFILLAITFYGIMMMMDIRTMDRFDDPKGKTITINAGE